MNRLGKLVTESLVVALAVLLYAIAPYVISRPALAEDAPAPAISEVHLVAFLHLSGEFSIEGKAYQQGIELAASEINDKGGVSGKKIKLLFEDTRYDPAVAAGLAAKPLADPALSGVIFSRQYELKKLAGVLKSAHLPTIVLGDSSPELEQIGDYVFGIGGSNSDAGRKALDFAVNTLKATSTYILSTNDDWFSGATKSYFEGALKAGVSVLGTNTINMEDKDFLAILSKVRNSGPDVFYAPVANNLPTLAKQVRASTVEKPVIVGDALSLSVLQSASKFVEGFYVTKVADPAGPALDAMKTAFHAKFKSEPAHLMNTALGYDAVKMFAAAIESGANSRDAIKEAIAKMSGMPGVSGTVTIDERRSRPQLFSIFQVKAGKLEPLEAAAAGPAGLPVAPVI